MKLGSKEEQELKLLIMGDDVNRAITYLECIDPKIIRHLFDISMRRLDDESLNIFTEVLGQNPVLISLMLAKLILKKNYVSRAEAITLFKP